MKAPAPQYARAKAAALRMIAELLQPDGIVLDAIEFRNEDAGFLIRLRYGNSHSQKIIPWDVIAEINLRAAGLFKMEFRQSLAALARHDFKKG